MPKLTTPRVLVEVHGGCAKIFADPGVRICFVEYDNRDYQAFAAWTGMPLIEMNNPEYPVLAVEADWTALRQLRRSDG